MWHTFSRIVISLAICSSFLFHVTTFALTPIDSKTTGFITVESSNCTIPVGSNQCGTKVSWSVTNPVSGQTRLQISSFGGYAMYQDSYSTTLWNPAGENTVTYTLSNNGILLDTKSLTSTCATGSKWDGKICSSGNTGTSSTSSTAEPKPLLQKTATLYLRGGDAIQIIDNLTETEAIAKCKASYTPTQSAGYLGCIWNGKDIFSAATGGIITSNAGASTTINPTTSIGNTVSLDAANKLKIDKIISALEKKIKTMSSQNALRSIDLYTARIKAISTSNPKSKVIVEYTLTKLYELKDSVLMAQIDDGGLFDAIMNAN